MRERLQKLQMKTERAAALTIARSPGARSQIIVSARVVGSLGGC